jgi:hypothetical protein
LDDVPTWRNDGGCRPKTKGNSQEVDARVGKGLIPQNSGAKSKQFEDIPLEKPKDTYSEIADIFPALQKYKDEHSTANLQKLMVEILEFCRSVYASTRSEDERKIYHNFIEKLNK